MSYKIVDEDTRLLAIFRYILTDDDVRDIAHDAYNVSTVTVHSWARDERSIRKMCEKGEYPLDVILEERPLVAQARKLAGRKSQYPNFADLRRGI